MTDEEKLAEEYAKANAKKGLSYREVTRTYDEITGYPYFLEDKIKKAFLAGLKAGRPKWHKVADGDLPKGDDSFGETSIHRKIYLKDRYGNLYTGNYYFKDECHSQDCFAVEFLDWGLQGANFCAKEQILEWCEIPKE